MLLSSDGGYVVKNSCLDTYYIYRLQKSAQFKGPHTFKREGSTRTPTLITKRTFTVGQPTLMTLS